MVNIVISDDNIEYAVNLMNYINKKYNNVKVCNITKDAKETLEILNFEKNIDVVLLDYKMLLYNDGEIMDYIKRQEKYNNSIIIMAKELKNFLKLKNNDSVHNVKCRINNATTVMYCNCEIEKLKKYFNFNLDTKPKVKTVINTVIRKIL